MPYATWGAKRGSMRRPGPRTGSGVPCGIQCWIRGMSQDPESHAELQMLPFSHVSDSPSFYVGPTPVRDPGYRVSCRTRVPACGIKSNIHVSHALSVTPCGIKSSKRTSMRDPAAYAIPNSVWTSTHHVGSHAVFHVRCLGTRTRSRVPRGTHCLVPSMSSVCDSMEDPGPRTAS